MRWLGLLLAAALAWAPWTGARAGDPLLQIELRQLDDLAPYVDALPLVRQGPGAMAFEAVNKALAEANARVLKRVEGCRAVSQRSGGGWRRAVAVTMRGPRYLSLLVQDDWQCGNASPDLGQIAVVFDLQTGGFADWRALLGSGLAQARGQQEAEDGTLVDTVSGKGLAAMYAKIVAAQTGRECDAALARADVPFMNWPDPENNALVLQPATVSRDSNICGRSVLLPMAQLRRTAISADLLNDIEAARRERWHGLE